MKNIFFSLWLKLVSLVLICLLPLSFLMIKISHEASQSFDFKTEEVIKKLTRYENILKDESKRENAEKEKLKEEFQDSVSLRRKFEDQSAFIKLFYERIRKQVLEWLFFVASISLLLSTLLSLSIKKQFKKLFEENLINLNKINVLRQLESWQRALRVLVHEIRGPLTPLKLTISSLKEKSQIDRIDLGVPNEALKKYFDEGCRFSLDQIGYIERLMQSFTSFTRLPKPDKKMSSLIHMLTEFIRISNEVYGISIEFNSSQHKGESDMILFDRDLIMTVLNNLIKNAKESGATLYAIRLKLEDAYIELDIQNNSPMIPTEIENYIFEFGISSKTEGEGNNLGVGLTICKKIILDHGGDLILHSNNNDTGVVFRIILPKQLETE